MWINKKQYENQLKTKLILYHILPISSVMYSDINKLVNRGYPSDRIIKIIREKYKKYIYIYGAINEQKNQEEVEKARK